MSYANLLLFSLFSLFQGSAHQIRFDPPPREIIIDGCVREMSFLGVVPVVLIPPQLPPGAPVPIGGPKLLPHGIRFDGPEKEIFIDGESYLMPLNRAVRIRIDKRSYEAAFGMENIFFQSKQGTEKLFLICFYLFSWFI